MLPHRRVTSLCVIRELAVTTALELLWKPLSVCCYEVFCVDKNVCISLRGRGLRVSIPIHISLSLSLCMWCVLCVLHGRLFRYSSCTLLYLLYPLCTNQMQEIEEASTHAYVHTHKHTYTHSLTHAHAHTDMYMFARTHTHASSFAAEYMYVYAAGHITHDSCNAVVARHIFNIAISICI